MLLFGMDIYQLILWKLPPFLSWKTQLEIPVIKQLQTNRLGHCPHLNYLKFVYLKFYKCTLLHMITSLDLKQNTLLDNVYFLL